MSITRLVSHLQTSRTSRFGLEILASVIFLFWLPLPLQILAAIFISMICEVIFAKTLGNSLKKEFSGKNWSEILENLDSNN